MAILSIPASDTHKVDYKNGTLTAKRLGTTIDIKFYDGNDSDLGFSIRVNNKGYLCDTNGTLYTNGVFLREDAVVTYVGPSGTTSWTVKGQSDTPVEDGKLLDVDGNVVWSANSAGNYTLNYNDLINKPKINEWSESQQDVVVTSQGAGEWDTVTVDKYAKFMAVGATSAPVDGVIKLKFTPEVANRWGQVIQVLNVSTYPLWIHNDSDDSAVTSIMPGEICEIVYTSSMLYAAGEKFYVKNVDATSFDVVDGGPNWWFVNPGNIAGWNPATTALRVNLKNTKIKDILITYRPNLANENQPMRLEFRDPNNSVLRSRDVPPNETVKCYAHVDGSYVDFVGDNVPSSVAREYTCNSTGGAGTEYALVVGDDVDTAIAVLDGQTPQGTVGTPTNVDLILKVGPMRKKRLKIIFANFQLKYAQLTLKKMQRYLTELTVNYTNCPVLVFSSSDWKSMVSPSVVPFVTMEVDFLPSGSGTDCIATVMLQSMWA